MANIYVTPLLSPSFERLPDHSAPEIRNDHFPTNGDYMVEPKDKEDENANTSIPYTTDSKEACGIKSHGRNSIKGGSSDEQYHLQNGTTANELGTAFVDLKYDKTTGNDVKSPSSTKSSLELQLSPAPQSRALEKSPVYCFHSFTYGVGGSSSQSLHDKSKEPTPCRSTSSSWQGESYDGDSPFVRFTRTVVDSEDSGSPTILLDCDSESEENLSHLTQDQPVFKEIDRKSPEGVQSMINNKATETSSEDVGKTPVIKRGNEDFQDNRTGDEDEAGQSARRPSPDGAECEDVSTSGGEHGTKVGRLVPGRSAGVGCSVGTPSGVLANCNYWIWEDGSEGKNVVDGEYLPEGDQVSLLWPGKGPLRYTNEGVVLQEIEKGALVSCFSCIRCVII